MLGAVELWCDGVPLRLTRQEATVLAMLVAADDQGVPRSELVDALWDEAPERDLLSPILSRLRRHLLPGGLTVNRGMDGVGHRLVPGDTGSSDTTIDLARFVGLVEVAERALDGDVPAMASRSLRRAAALWRGLPFGTSRTAGTPARLRRAADRLWTYRTRLLRAWARVGLRTETHEVLGWLGSGDTLSEAADHEPDEDVWLLTVVRAIAEGATAEAERLVDARRRTTGRYDDDLVARAFALLHRAERGVPIRSRPSVSAEHAPGGALDIAVAQLTSASPDPDRGLVAVEGSEDGLLVRCRSAADAAGALLAVGLGASPLADLAARLHTFALRDRAVGAVSSAVAGDLDAAEPDPEQVAALLDRVARRSPVLVVLGADLDAAARTLLARCRARRVAVVVAGARATLRGRPRPAPSDADTVWACGAAVVEDGEHINSVVVAQVLEQLDPTLDAEAALASSVAADLVTADHDGFRFVDHGARRVALRELWSNPGRAREWHLAAYRVLAARVPPSGRAADHAWRARPLLTDDDVARIHLTAARRYVEEHQGERAVAIASRGLELAGSSELRFSLLMCQGDAHHDGGRMGLAATTYRSAVETAPTALQRAEAVLRLARRWSDPGRVDPELVALLRAARDGLPDDGAHQALDLRLRAHLAHKTTMALHDPDPAEAVDDVRRILDAVGPEVDAEAACDVLVECRWTLFDHAPPSATRAISRELEKRSVEAASLHYRWEALVCGIVDDLRLGAMDAARRATERHRDIVERHAHGLGPWLAPTLDTLFDIWDGRLDDAERRLGRQDTSAFADDADSLRQTWLGQQFWLRREQGRSADLLSAATGQQVARRHYFPVWSAGTALLLADVGLTSAALDQVDAALAQVGGIGGLPQHGWRVPTLALLAETVDVVAGPARGLDAGDGADRARRLAAELDEALSLHDGEVVLAGWPTVLLGPVARFRAQLALVLGRPQDVPALLEQVRPATLSPHQRAWLRAVEARAAAVSGAEQEARGLAAAAVALANYTGGGLLRTVATALSG